MANLSKDIIIDGGVFFGRDTKSSLSASVNDILAAMNCNNINMAVVASFKAIFCDQTEGNSEMMAIAEKFKDRIIPMAVISPFSFIPNKGTIKSLAKQGFKIIGTFPLYQSWPLGTAVFKKMAEEISKEGLSLQVAIGNWQQLSEVSNSLGGMDLPVLIRWIRGGGYLYLTEEIALGQEYNNLYFDVGTMVTTGGINKLCSEIGADRLYMSSNMPLVYERSVYYRVYAEELSSKDRKKIYSGTLLNILDIEYDKHEKE